MPALVVPCDEVSPEVGAQLGMGGSCCPPGTTLCRDAVVGAHTAFAGDGGCDHRGCPPSCGAGGKLEMLNWKPGRRDRP